MNWQVILGFSVFLLSLTTILQKTLMKNVRADPAASAIASHFITTIIVGIFIILTGHLNFSAMPRISINLLILMVLIGGYYLLAFNSLKNVDASLFVIIMSIRPLFTILASTIFLGEGLNPKQFVGFALIVVAIIFVMYKKEKIQFKTGSLLAIFAAMSFGFAGTNDRVALKIVPLPEYIFVSNILPLIFLIFVNINKVGRVKKLLTKPILKNLLVMCFVQLIAVGSMLWALQIAPNSSQVSSVLDLTIIVTLIMGVVFLKEKADLGKKIVASIISFAGLMLLQ